MPIKVRLKPAGVRSILTGGGVKADLRSRATRVQSTASTGMQDPEGMALRDASDSRRARYVVLTANAEAMYLEANERRLTRALDSGR